MDLPPLELRAPSPAVVVAIEPEADTALPGTLVLETMKTWLRVPLCSPDGTRWQPIVRVGQPIAAGQLIALIPAPQSGGAADAAAARVTSELEVLPWPTNTQRVAALAVGAPAGGFPASDLTIQPSDRALCVHGAVAGLCTLRAVDRAPVAREDGGWWALPPVERARAFGAANGDCSRFDGGPAALLGAWWTALRAVSRDLTGSAETTVDVATQCLERCAHDSGPGTAATALLIKSLLPLTTEESALLEQTGWRPAPADSSALSRVWAEAGLPLPPQDTGWLDRMSTRTTATFRLRPAAVLGRMETNAAEDRARKLLERGVVAPDLLAALVLDGLADASMDVESNEPDVGIVLARVHCSELPPFLVLFSDPTVSFASLSNAECSVVTHALELAGTGKIQLLWFAMSSGARIDRHTGTENLDGTAHTLRRILETTGSGVSVTAVVVGPCVGAQAYWLAAIGSTLRSRGTLIVTERGSLVLSGTRSLQFSGAPSEQDETLLGGYTVLGSRGQAAHYAATVEGAWSLALSHLRLSSAGAVDRSRACGDLSKVVVGDHQRTLNDVVGSGDTTGRHQSWSVRPLMEAMLDADSPTLWPWDAWADARQVIVARGRLSGRTCWLIGVDQRSSEPEWSRTIARGHVFQAGTLYPESSRKIARAIHAAAGEPVILLANLAGFDGSLDSLMDGQLESGAEIAGAVATSGSPLLVMVLTRYHGGAFVVFSKRLGADVTSFALDGSFASVIGGIPAAAIVFGAEAKRRAGEFAGEPDPVASALKAVGQEFDAHHSVERALRMGSLDRIVGLWELQARVSEWLACAGAMDRV